MMEDGIAYPKLPDETPETVPRDSEGRPFHPGSGDLGWVAVRADLVDDVREAADVCPVECIFIDEE
jgi:ferredoxin